MATEGKHSQRGGLPVPASCLCDNSREKEGEWNKDYMDASVFQSTRRNSKLDRLSERLPHSQICQMVNMRGWPSDPDPLSVACRRTWKENSREICLTTEARRDLLPPCHFQRNDMVVLGDTRVVSANQHRQPGKLNRKEFLHDRGEIAL